MGGIYEIPFDKMIAFRRAYNTSLIVTGTEDNHNFYRVSTITPAGHFSSIVDKNESFDAANKTALLAMQDHWNEPQGGDIIDLWSHNFATNNGDWAFTVSTGKKLQVDWFRGQMSNNMHFPVGNPFHMVILVSYGAVLPVWSGTRTDLTDSAWVLDSTSDLEIAQEYKRYVHVPDGINWDGQVALDFSFSSLRDLVGKSTIQDIAQGADDTSPLKISTSNYQSRGARLQLRSSLNERIECYSHINQVYKDINGGFIDLARVTVAFSRYPEF